MNEHVTRRGLLAAAGGTLTTATAGCVGGDLDESESTSETFDVQGISRLAVDGLGRVVVRGEDRDDVAVTGEKRAASEDGLDDVWLESDRDGGTLALGVEREDGPFVFQVGPKPTMHLTVRVPRDLRVVAVETPNGRTEVTDVRGDLSVDVVNGAVTISAIHGDLNVDGANGDLVVSGVTGDVSIEGTNGDVEVDGAESDVDVQTTNGDVTVAVPADLDATLDLDTTNGDVTVTGVAGLSGAEDFPVTVGDGGRRIVVSTTNGDVTLDGNE